MSVYVVEKLDAMLHYADLDGAGSPIVFLHGLGCASTYDYAEVAAHGALAGHRRILVDLLGAGYSETVAGFDYTPANHAAYLKGFLDRLHLPPYYLFGHSMGGAIAVLLAQQLVQNLRAVILTEPHIDPAAKGSASRFIASFSEEDFARRGFAALKSAAKRAEGAGWYGSLQSWGARTLHSAAAAIAEGGNPSWREAMYRLICPVHVIVGSQSKEDFKIDEMRKNGITVHIAQGVGHGMAWENAAITAEAIAKAIATVENSHNE